jgi:hypothetical protein
MSSGSVMTRPFIEKNLGDFVVDYTWRNFGRRIVRCPTCNRKGHIGKRNGNDVVIVHREWYRADEEITIIDSCSVSVEKLRDALYRKEKARRQTLEYNCTRRPNRKAS